MAVKGLALKFSTFVSSCQPAAQALHVVQLQLSSNRRERSYHPEQRRQGDAHCDSQSRIPSIIKPSTRNYAFHCWLWRKETSAQDSSKTFTSNRRSFSDSVCTRIAKGNICMLAPCSRTRKGQSCAMLLNYHDSQLNVHGKAVDTRRCVHHAVRHR